MEGATSSLLDNGVLGAVAVLLIVALGVLWRENKGLQDKLYRDAKDTLTGSINAQNNLANALDKLTDKIETGGRNK